MEPSDARWEEWERAIATQGITLDRPRHARHPQWSSIVYPIDYGYVNGVLGEDGAELDVFVGTADTGVVAYERTVDHRKGDTELKLLYNCSPTEIYLVHGFLNFDPRLMQGQLVLRWPMEELWHRLEVR
ncbi:MAG TPA: hypothetical protein V6D05_16450 [Stenomitos sp.]